MHLVEMKAATVYEGAHIFTKRTYREQAVRNDD